MRSAAKNTICATKFLFAGLTALIVLAPNPSIADDGLMHVFLNHAKVLKLDRPVSKVIVGNAKVADATVADSQTIVLTGKSFGTTNLVLLDADGEAILDERVLVSIDEDNTLRLFRQTNRIVYSCTPACEEHEGLGTDRQ